MIKVDENKEESLASTMEPVENAEPESCPEVHGMGQINVEQELEPSGSQQSGEATDDVMEPEREDEIEHDVGEPVEKFVKDEGK